MSNPFLTKKDPLLEAVRSAMQDGEIRRQAEALVNEEFGVYSRKAVVREDLAAYDARLEEAYKCMKEGEKPEKKEKKDDGKAEYSKMREKMVGKGKDYETTKKIVGEAKKLADKDYDKDGKIESPKDEVWGSRFRAAKMAGKMEEKKMYEAEVDYSAPDRAAVTRDNKPSTPAQTNAATSGPSASDKAALSNKIKTMQEAAYSAKAARAGKDIGKPGKSFKMIAKSAAERYGSEERGKKVAGAILKKIRAKHMKEEQIDEIVVQKSQMRPGETLRDTMNRLQHKTRIDRPSSAPSTSSAPKASPVDAPSPKSQTGSSRMDALKSITNPTPTVSKTQNMGSAISTGSSSAMDKVSDLAAKQAATPGERTAPVNKMQNMGTSISTGGSSAMDTVSSMGASQASDTQKAKDVAKGVTSFAQQSSITGGIGAASNAKDSRNKFSVDENKSLRESVQVGANKYRIV